MSDERYSISRDKKNPSKIKISKVKLNTHEDCTSENDDVYQSFYKNNDSLKLTLKKVPKRKKEGKKSAFDKSIVHRTFFIRGNQRDPIKVLQKYKERIFLLLNRKLKISPTKFYITLQVKFYKYVADEKITYVHFFNGSTQTLLHTSNLERAYDESVRKIYENVDSHIKQGSNFIIQSVEKLNVCTYRYCPIKASSYIPTPKWIQSKGAIINVKNYDSRCFEYAILTAFRLAEDENSKNLDRVFPYKPYLGKLKCVTPDMRIQDIPKFERANNTPVSVYTVKKNEKTIYPLYITKMRHKPPIQLLLIEGNGKNHYTYIKNLNRLLNNRKYGTKVFCPYCCYGYWIQKNGKRNLAEHIEMCSDYGPQRTKLLDEEDKFIQFNEHEKRLKSPFTLFADFETLNVKLNSVKPDEQSYTENKTIHQVSGFAFYTSSVFHPPNLVSYRGEDAGEVFLKKIIEEVERIEILLNKIEPIIISPEQENEFQSATLCHICEKGFQVGEEGDYKVRDHCHFTGFYRGAAHNSCNLKLRVVKKIPIFFHNLVGYDSHIIFQNLTKMDEKIEPKVIAKGMEKFITFSLKNLQFKDSLQFLNSSLDTLVANLRLKQKSGKTLQELFPNLFNYFQSEWSHLSLEDFELLSRKGVYPYQFMDSHEKFQMRELPSRSCFYNDITKKDISDEDYEFVQTLWDRFGMETMGSLHDLYMICDTLLLSDIFDNFRNFSLKHYGLDPAHFTTAPGLSWSASLLLTKQVLEIPTDPNMHIFFDRGMRGGISLVANPFAQANNEFMDNFNSSLPRSEIKFYDANNQYGWAMEHFLPTHGFEWVEVETMSLEGWREFILNQSKDQEIGYFFEVDLHYPVNLHDDHDNFPLAPEHLDIKEEMLSQYQKDLGKELEVKVGGKKLCLTLSNKYNYITHYRNLKMYLERGLKLLKVHRVLKFVQSPWLKPYIDLNTSLRKSANNKFEEGFAKLMNNSFFGKTCEDVRKYRDVKIVLDKKKAEKLISRPSLEQCKIYEENLVALQLKRKNVTLNKPRYIGMSVLEISKLIMYDFHYDFIMKNYPGSKLLFSDTDSFCYWIPSEANIDETIIGKSDWFDFSNFPQDHPNFDTINKLIPGKFKDEMGGTVIIEFCGLRSKMYSIKLLNGWEKKAGKGILTEVKKNQITHEDYKTALFRRKQMVHVGTKILNQNHNLYTAEVKKISLSPFNDKKFILWDGEEYTTYSFAHYKTKDVPMEN